MCGNKGVAAYDNWVQQNQLENKLKFWSILWCDKPFTSDLIGNWRAYKCTHDWFHSPVKRANHTSKGQSNLFWSKENWKHCHCLCNRWQCEEPQWLKLSIFRGVHVGMLFLFLWKYAIQKGVLQPNVVMLAMLHLYQSQINSLKDICSDFIFYAKKLFIINVGGPAICYYICSKILRIKADMPEIR